MDTKHLRNSFNSEVNFTKHMNKEHTKLEKNGSTGSAEPIFLKGFSAKSVLFSAKCLQNFTKFQQVHQSLRSLPNVAKFVQNFIKSSQFFPNLWFWQCCRNFFVVVVIYAFFLTNLYPQKVRLTKKILFLTLRPNIRESGTKRYYCTNKKIVLPIWEPFYELHGVHWRKSRI